MKKFFSLIILAASILSCMHDKDGQKRTLHKNGGLLIDVRTEKEYERGHLEKAINIPYTEIKKKIKEHVKDKGEKIILYCRSGRRSGIAKKMLEEVGYKNVINAGSYEKLKTKERGGNESGDRTPLKDSRRDRFVSPLTAAIRTEGIRC